MIVWDHEKLLYYRGGLSSLYMFSFQVVFEISECIIFFMSLLLDKFPGLLIVIST